MKSILPLIAVVFVLISPSCLEAQFSINQAADRVVGAPDFTTVGSATDDANGLEEPNGVAIDPTTQKLFVASSLQNRILRYASAASLANGESAEAVFGQDDFSGTASGTAANRLNIPYGIFVDEQGRLWIADLENDRVLMFEDAATRTNGASADLVLGQDDFTSRVSGNSSTRMDNPVAVFVDGNDNLWVAEYLNHRVTKFAAVSGLSNGAAASLVIGQADFGMGGAGTSETQMQHPAGVVVDELGNLWVAEQSNNRVLRFANAATLANGAAATAVLGQSLFGSATATTSVNGMSSPTALLAEPDGTLWVLEYNSRRAIAFFNAASKSSGADADLVLGQPDFVTSDSGVTDKNLAGTGFGIARDSTGRLWIPDRANHRVLRFSPTMVDTTRPVLVVKTRPDPVTSLARYRFKGSASDAGGIKEVLFRVGAGAFRRASGTTSWSFRASLIRNKRNKIQIYAVDLAGNQSEIRTYRIKRN